MIHADLTISDRTSFVRRNQGAKLAAVHVGETGNPADDFGIISSDPDALDLLAAELTTAAEMLRLARVAEYRAAS